jgi:hypothetical protein
LPPPMKAEPDYEEVGRIARAHGCDLSVRGTTEGRAG